MSAALPRYKEAKRQFEAIYLRRALELSKGNVSRAARMTGVDRRTLYNMLDRAGVERPRHRGRPGRGCVYQPPPAPEHAESWGIA